MDDKAKIKAYAKQRCDEVFGPGHWEALDQLIIRESGWRPTAKNPDSTAYGIFQFLDKTWASVGGTKTTDPALQIEYGLKYIKARYGTPEEALAFWKRQSPHWY